MWWCWGIVSSHRSPARPRCDRIAFAGQTKGKWVKRLRVKTLKEFPKGTQKPSFGQDTKGFGATFEGWRRKTRRGGGLKAARGRSPEERRQESQSHPEEKPFQRRASHSG